MKLPHVIESQQFTVPLLMELFERTRRMEKIVERGRHHLHHDDRGDRRTGRHAGLRK